jgi:hypothetical protein
MARNKFPLGNKYGGRKPGSRNKPTAIPRFVYEDSDRSEPARKFQLLAARMALDLGGAENLSQGELQLIRRCAMISVQCELMERTALAGTAFDATTYSTLTGQLTRALRTLGLKRQPHDTTPSLRDYLDAARQPDGAFKIEDGETAGNA